MDRQRQQSSRGNATATRGGGSSGKGGGGGVGKAAGKKPIKVSIISCGSGDTTQYTGPETMDQELFMRAIDVPIRHERNTA
uniref:Uncharacterized protein n=1 Tax=Oryza glumipatula TaxID=40148 RepID=A0A0D9Y9L1_9ORYZ